LGAPGSGGGIACVCRDVWSALGPDAVGGGLEELARMQTFNPVGPGSRTDPEQSFSACLFSTSLTFARRHFNAARKQASEVQSSDSTSVVGSLISRIGVSAHVMDCLYRTRRTPLPS
jgi:hypothetical protein